MATLGVAGVAAIVAAGAAVASVVQTRRASKEQRRLNEIQNRIAATKRVRDIRKAIALSRIARAEVQASGFQFGATGGSAVGGALSGITGDLAGTIGAANQQFTGQQALASSQNRISGLQSSASTFGAISSLAGSFTGPSGAQNSAAIQPLIGIT